MVTAYGSTRRWAATIGALLVEPVVSSPRYLIVSLSHSASSPVATVPQKVTYVARPAVEAYP